MNLSVLIATIPQRKDLFIRLIGILNHQIQTNNLNEKVEILACIDKCEHSIGEKRNMLLSHTSGKFSVFVDDDDTVSDNFCHKLNSIIEAKDVDYIGYKLSRTFDGQEQPCEYRSIYYDRCYKLENGVSFRHISHTNPIRTNIAKQFLFPHKNKGEDIDWCEEIYKSKLVKTEHFIPESMYYQIHKSNKINNVITTSIEEYISQIQNVRWITFDSPPRQQDTDNTACQA